MVASCIEFDINRVYEQQHLFPLIRMKANARLCTIFFIDSSSSRNSLLHQLTHFVNIVQMCMRLKAGFLTQEWMVAYPLHKRSLPPVDHHHLVFVWRLLLLLLLFLFSLVYPRNLISTSGWHSVRLSVEAICLFNLMCVHFPRQPI